VLLLCGAGNLPVENFTPQGPMQADLNAGGHNLTNAATISATNVAVSGALTAPNFTLPLASVTGNPVTVTAGKTLAVANTLTLAGTDGSTLNVGAGGTLGSAAFSATSAFLATSAIGTTVQAYNANTTTLGNAVNGASNLVQTDSNGLLVDAVQRPAAKTIYVSQSKGSDTRTGLSKYSLHTPFATLTAAASAAAAGDTIIAEDGVFTDKNLVLVTGVDWLFLPGASVAVTGAVNGDVIFKDSGTAATALVAGCGQTFSISSTASGATVYAVSITAASNLTVQNISLASSGTGSSATIATVESNNASAVIAITGNLTSTATGSATSAGLNIDTAGGGTITVNGNVSATGAGGNGTAINCVSATTSSGTVTVTGRVSSNSIAIYGSSTCTLTCGSLGDGSGGSFVYNHLTLLGVGQVSTTTTPATGFTASDNLGPQDHLFELTPAGTLASGTVNLPPDDLSRTGERVTVLTTLTVAVPSSGTLYGYTADSVGPGSITFEKIGSNTWVKL
jgi:hypothetical protein